VKRADKTYARDLAASSISATAAGSMITTIFLPESKKNPLFLLPMPLLEPVTIAICLLPDLVLQLFCLMVEKHIDEELCV